MGSLESFNLYLLQKWRWRFLTQPNALWVSDKKYARRRWVGVDFVYFATHGTWANVVASIHALHTSVIIPNRTNRLKVECRSQVRF